MSSATSIDPSASRSPKLEAGHPRARRAKPAAKDASEAAPADEGLRPWQFFVLSGMLAATAAVIVATGQSPASIIVLSFTVVASSLVALGAYRALAPLIRPETASAPQLLAGRTRAALEREKTLVLRSIKELEFDFAMGKISQADYEDMAGRLRARAIGLMRQLDEGAGYKTAIELELKKRIGSAVAVEPRPRNESSGEVAIGAAEAPALQGDDAETVERPLRECECGVVNDSDARFCKHCGSKLSAA